MTSSVSTWRSRLVVIAALFALVGALAACGNDDAATTTEPGPTTTESTVPPQETVEPVPASFPVTVTAANGEVTISDQPTRIVSLSASLTEMLYAVGAGDQVHAVDQYSDHPSGTPMTELSGFRPNLEAIVGFEPDLVVLASDRDGIVDALSGAGITVLWLPSAVSVDDALDQVAIIATASGHPAAGAELVDTLRADLDAIAATAEGAEPLTYYYELSDSLHSATSDSFIGSLLALIGLESIADGVDPEAGKFPQLSAEYVLGADPDLILTPGTIETTEAIATRPGWDQLTAVAEGRVVALDENIASRWGPRIVELLEAVDSAVRTTGVR